MHAHMSHMEKPANQERMKASLFQMLVLSLNLLLVSSSLCLVYGAESNVHIKEDGKDQGQANEDSCSHPKALCFNCSHFYLIIIIPN